MKKTVEYINRDGLTVTELKMLINNWPEHDANGQPCEVWMGTGPGLSSSVKVVRPLNQRAVDGNVYADLLLEVLP